MTTAHFTAPTRRRQMRLTPEVSKEVERLLRAYRHQDQFQIDNSKQQLAFWDDLQMLADSDATAVPLLVPRIL
jgi:hypothetical protein